jgi:hypothetical protein
MLSVFCLFSGSPFCSSVNGDLLRFRLRFSSGPSRFCLSSLIGSELDRDLDLWRECECDLSDDRERERDRDFDLEDDRDRERERDRDFDLEGDRLFGVL